MHNTPLNIYDAQDAKDENIKSSGGDAIDRPTNKPNNNFNANKEKYRKNRFKIANVDTTKVGHFRFCCRRLSLLWTWGIYQRRKKKNNKNRENILAFTSHISFQFCLYIFNGNWQWLEKWTRKTTSSWFYIWRKVFSCCRWFLSFFLCARMYGPFDHSGIQHWLGRWFAYTLQNIQIETILAWTTLRILKHVVATVSCNFPTQICLFEPNKDMNIYTIVQRLVFMFYKRRKNQLRYSSYRLISSNEYVSL